MIYPDWKILLARRCITKGEVSKIEDVNNLISILNNTCDNPEAVSLMTSALEIYDKELFVREIIEACMLCDDYNSSLCEELFGIPTDILKIYNYYFFDTTVFKYKLQKHEYVRVYQNDNFKDAHLYKIWAISAGMEFFKWKFNPTTYSVAPKAILNNLIGDTFFRAKEHLNEPLTSATAKEALKWIKQAVDSIGGLRALEGSNNDDALKNFYKVAIEYKDSTKKKDFISDAEIVE